MKYALYVTSEQAWKAMLKEVTSAKKSIYIEMYIFLDDTKGFEFFDVLKRKASHGVSVKIIFDSFGSAALSQKDVSDLKESGIEVLFFSYWFRRTHRKIMIIDERTAFLGGVNISESFRYWNDLQVKVHGASARMILRAFAKTYRVCGGTGAKIIEQYEPPFLKKTKMWIVDHWPMHKKYSLKHAYKEHILKARKEIKIVTPYFAPSRWMKACLHQAVLRGVSVKILVPRSVEYKIFTRINYYYIGECNKLGIKVYLLRHMNHAKAILIDNKKGIVGSQNFDVLSFGFNNEISVCFENKKLIKFLRNIFDIWIKDAEVFNGQTFKIRWYDYIIAFFIRIFEPMFY
ncbi:MAG: phosphatidylserine/phosphatidylglycerophosphate/cardiolipin synthase family protein [bacterium]